VNLPIFDCTYRSDVRRSETCQACGSRDEQYGVFFCNLHQVECADRRSRTPKAGSRPYRSCNTCDDCTGRGADSKRITTLETVSRSSEKVVIAVRFCELPDSYRGLPASYFLDISDATGVPVSFNGITVVIPLNVTHLIVIPEPVVYVSNHASQQMLRSWQPGIKVRCCLIPESGRDVAEVAPIFLVSVVDSARFSSLRDVIIKSRLVKAV
jgi:hypothetical protein